MRFEHKSMALWVLAIVLLLIIIQVWEQGRQTMVADFSYSRFVEAVKAKKIKSVSFSESSHEISGEIRPEFEKEFGGKKFRIPGNTGDEGYKMMVANGITPDYDKSDSGNILFTILANFVPILLIIFFFTWLLKQIQVGGGKAMSFGKSRARLLTENKKKVMFADVAGVDEAKHELEEIVLFLKEPKKYTKLGGRIPKGVLLIGPPGTGKTLLGRAVAGEAGVPFFTISGSDFVEMFVGVGASRVRDLFEQGKKHAPCLIFIDEIDAVGRHRGAGMGGGHDEREQTLNQLLVEMDGFESNEGVILIAATNRPDVLDPALLRPGRFDRRVIVNKPDLVGRHKILMVHARKTPLSSDVNLEKIARGTPGMSGADLENLVNEAALIAASEDKSKISMSDLERAKDKIMMGAERKSMVIGEEDKRITAYHEAGHALVGKSIPGIDPIHKVTIIPRGMALGLTQTLPEEERLNLSKTKAHNMIAFLFGGRAAEELVFHDSTTGAGNDIERATDIARKMVCEWGMSDKLGPLAYEKSDSPVFVGMNYGGNPPKEYSDQKAQDIDKEVYLIVTTGYEKAKKILSENMDKLKIMAEALLEYETIDTDDVNLIFSGGSLEQVKNRRESRAIEVSKELAETAVKDEEDNKAKKKAPQGGRDPVGNSGPVTA
ncbi:MAG: ATP-dependent zinc metalloprotease FtsH [Pseudomonadota bacterium]|nr:ATP-dependent zinc metalloprotease FtsH [Pseudomonadota bacterium]